MNNIITHDTYDIIKHQASDLDLVIITRDSYITRTALNVFVIAGLIIGLIFLSIERNNAFEKAETFKAAVSEHEEFESYLQTENEKVRATAKAAAERLKQSAENVAELRDVLEQQMKDIDTLFVERNALREEVKTLRTQIGENPYKDIKLTDSERDLLKWVLALECKGEPEAGRKACLEEIFNRVLRRDWKGETVGEILAAPGQFDGYDIYMEYLTGTRKKLHAYPDESEDAIIEYVLTHGRTILPKEYVYFATYKANGRDFIRIGNHYFSRDE